MRRLGALLLLLGAVLVLRRTMAADVGADLRDTALAFGFALIAAGLAGGLFERLRLPRISGYLVFGLAMGPYAGDLISRGMAADLNLINGLAIALIAFIAGLEINFARMRERLAGIAVVGAWTMGVTFVLIFVALLAAWPWLPFAPDATGIERVGIALVTATVLVSFSPTITIAVIAESRARGPLSELSIAIVVLADLVLILGFTLVMQFMRSIAGVAPGESFGFVSDVAWAIIGSLAFGAIVGALFAFYLRFVGRELTLILLVLCVVISTAGATFHLEPLLAALAAGLVVENVAPPRGDALSRAVEGGALPVLVVFFVAAGASVQVDALGSLGVLAAALAALRVAGVRLGTMIGLRQAGLARHPTNMLWTGLISQAGVTLGLTVIVASEFAGWGVRIQTLMVALIAIHELAGPVLFRAALARAGEVGQR